MSSRAVAVRCPTGSGKESKQRIMGVDVMLWQLHSAIMGIRLETGANPDEVTSELLAIPGITNVVMVAGRYDFFVHYVCRNMEEYRRFVVERFRKIPGIANIEGFIGLDLYERKFEVGVIG